MVFELKSLYSNKKRMTFYTIINQSKLTTIVNKTHYHGYFFYDF